MAGSDHIKSVLKAAELLTLVGDSESGLKLAQIAGAMNQKLPAIHHLARTLISCGFLRKRPDNVLLLGREFIRLADNARDDALTVAASAEMTRLFNLLPQSVVVLAELAIPQVDMALRISYERPNVIEKERGKVFNIYVNAVALACLAHVGDTERELMMNKQPFAEYGAHLWKGRDRFEAFLTKAREDGFVVCPFDRDVSLRAAAPVIKGDGGLAGALGVSLPASRAETGTVEALQRELRESVSRIAGKI